MKHLLPESGRFYKANLHMHTTISDGKMTPEETKAAYMSRGYSIVAFTDHEVIVPHPELCDENFLAITSTEYCVAGHVVNSVPICYHLNFLAKRPDLTVSSSHSHIWLSPKQKELYVTEEMSAYDDPRTHSVEHVNDMIARAREEGFLVTLNHPYWSTQTYADYAGLKGLFGIECYNNDCTLGGYEDSMQPIDDLLHFDENLFPLATDDAHGKPNDSTDSDCFGGFVMIKADKLDYTAVMTALERGDFYASSGPEIHSLTVEDGKLKLTCSPAEKIIVTSDCRWAARKTANAPITESEIDLSGWLNLPRVPEHRVCTPYIRVTVVDEKGDRAWTRAYHLDEITK